MGVHIIPASIPFECTLRHTIVFALGHTFTVPLSSLAVISLGFSMIMQIHNIRSVKLAILSQKYYVYYVKLKHTIKLDPLLSLRFTCRTEASECRYPQQQLTQAHHLLIALFSTSIIFSNVIIIQIHHFSLPIHCC